MNDSVVEMNADNAVYKTLLESTKAIPWKIDWATMQFAYIGPQIEDLLGWSPASWAGINDWIERIHPEDREYVVNCTVGWKMDIVRTDLDGNLVMYIIDEQEI